MVRLDGTASRALLTTGGGGEGVQIGLGGDAEVGESCAWGRGFGSPPSGGSASKVPARPLPPRASRSHRSPKLLSNPNFPGVELEEGHRGGGNGPPRQRAALSKNSSSFCPFCFSRQKQSVSCPQHLSSRGRCAPRAAAGGGGAARARSTAHVRCGRSPRSRARGAAVLGRGGRRPAELPGPR